jgi:hypothetical protein
MYIYVCINVTNCARSGDGPVVIRKSPAYPGLGQLIADGAGAERNIAQDRNVSKK